MNLFKTAMLGVAMTAFAGASAAVAATASLIDNQVIIDNAPFYSVGPEDGLGGGNYALNHPSFIDIPYAIFDFGGASSVSSASLDLDYLAPYGGSGPASITLYAGGDVDGAISTADRFMGSALDTFVYAGGESRSIDVTAAINAVLAAGDWFAIRLEVDAAPGTLVGYLGGQFDTPSITYDAGVPPIPLPAGLPLLAGALVLIGATRARSRKS